jgi:limonene 1,2-monooxygenase
MGGAPTELRFGVFMAPFHTPGENPTLSIERDLELIVHLDRLGYDEAWVGEHHSTGWETVAAPEIVLAVAAERTRHIRLGTGAVSLPYHHPLLVADRIVLLDHLTRGRVMLGVGPGGHLSDALMLGLDPGVLRARMAESLDVIMRLFTETDPFTHVCDWFELHDAVLQLRPVQRPHPPVAVTSMESPSGMALAGRHGAGVLMQGGPHDLRARWAVAEQAASDARRTVSRRDWRISVPVHLADTRREALDQVREGAAGYVLDYTQRVTGRPSPVPGPRERIAEQMCERGSWVVGTPDDLIAFIEDLWARTGGFGALLVLAHEWAGREATLRSHELLARHVMPRFSGALDGIVPSEAVAIAKSTRLHEERVAAVARAEREHGTPASLEPQT